MRLASYYHKDGMGSVTNVTDAAGLPQWSYSYEPFGNSSSATKLNPLAPDNPMRFTGEYLDPTGIYHLRARQYDPGLGRFTTTDPWTPPITSPALSPYIYVNDRPTVFTDPTGMIPWLEQNNFDVFDPYSLPALGIEGKIFVGPSYDDGCSYANGFISCSSSTNVTTVTFTACWYGCLNIGTGGVSIGFVNIGPGTSHVKRGRGVAILVTNGVAAPNNERAVVGCYGGCFGGYKNPDGSGGSVLGLGTPGAFVGRSWPL